MQGLKRERRRLPPRAVNQEQLLSPLHIQGNRNPGACWPGEISPPQRKLVLLEGEGAACLQRRGEHCARLRYHWLLLPMLCVTMRHVVGGHHGAKPKPAYIRLLKHIPPRYSGMLSINATFQIMGRINPNRRVQRTVTDTAVRWNARRTLATSAAPAQRSDPITASRRSTAATSLVLPANPPGWGGLAGFPPGGTMPCRLIG